MRREEQNIGHIDVRVGYSIKGPLLLGAAAVAAAGAAYFLLTGDRSEEHNVNVTDSEITRFSSQLNTCIGDLATHNSINYVVENKVGVGPLRQEWEDYYHGEMPGVLPFCLKGATSIITTRTSLDQPPLPSDKVTVTIDKNNLFVNQPHIDAMPPKTFTVKNGKIIERDNRPVNPPQPIFAKDGTYEPGEYRSDGQDSAATDAYEGARLGKVDIGKDAHTNLTKIGQLEASRPECIKAAWEVVPPEKLTDEAFRAALVEQGYKNDPEHIIIKYVPGSEWPTPDNIKDEDGLTYAERRKALELVIPKSHKISSSVKCKSGNIKDTTTLQATISPRG